DLRKVIEKYETNFQDPYLPVYVLGNHDRKRVLSRVGGNINLAKLLAVLIFTVRGIPVTYYGEEIGMMEGNSPIKTCLDPVGQRYKNVPSFLLNALDLYVNRDGCRTPMQWDPGKNAGFSETDGKLWMPLALNYLEQNVEKLESNSGSILSLYKDLLRLRKSSPVLITGDLKLLETPADVLAYEREIPGEKIGIFLNFSESNKCIELKGSVDRILNSIHPDEIISDKIYLPPYGFAVIQYK
ncbi:MAG: alpha-glucosidase, partial [Chloroflexota bacterium]